MYRCPQCKSKRLEVVVEMWAALEQDEETGDFQTDIDEAENHDQEWGGDSTMRCVDCEYAAEVNSFDEENENGSEKR